MALPAIIPTASKAKLPKHLSYPIGAEAISRGVLGIPQFDSISLSFYDKPTVFEKDHRAMLASGGPYPVMVAKFSKWPKTLSSSRDMEIHGWFDKRWEIIVYPVLKTQRLFANQLIANFVLPRVREWLVEGEKMAWGHGVKQLNFQFDPTLRQISVRAEGGVLSD